jgi:hypothetical protein
VAPFSRLKASVSFFCPHPSRLREQSNKVKVVFILDKIKVFLF